MKEICFRKAAFAPVAIACLTAITICTAAPLIPAASAANPATTVAETAALPAGAHLSEHIYGNLPGLDNVGRVSPGIYRGAQPTNEGYATLKRMGIRTVINLRNSMSEKTAVERAGMRSIEVPMEMSRDGLRAKVERVVALMADPANRPVFVHCRHGRDRTGIVVAAYRMKMEGWQLPAAEAEMQGFGFNDLWVNFREFIRDYGAEQVKK